MKKPRNGSIEDFEKGTNINTGIKKKLVVEGSAIPVMNEQGIVIYIKNGEIIYDFRKNLFTDASLVYFESKKYIN